MSVALQPEPPRADLKIEQVLQIHVRAVKEWWNGNAVYVCAECGQSYPCRTRQILGG